MLDRIFVALSFAILALLVFVVIFAGWIQPHDPLLQNFAAADQGMSSTYWLGTDSFGRDILSRLIEGARLSMTIGVTAPLVAAIVGVSLGATSAFFGGWAERVISRATDVM